mmetsp:Transcript_20363/g.63266  ORF Transcript_20363/g.63266 Transcript_20363/m.63266 type:complete len:377 (-) Transcript_20363:312-1442(-)
MRNTARPRQVACRPRPTAWLWMTCNCPRSPTVARRSCRPQRGVPPRTRFERRAWPKCAGPSARRPRRSAPTPRDALSSSRSSSPASNRSTAPAGAAAARGRRARRRRRFLRLPRCPPNASASMRTSIQRRRRRPFPWTKLLLSIRATTLAPSPPPGSSVPAPRSIAAKTPLASLRPSCRAPRRPLLGRGRAFRPAPICPTATGPRHRLRFTRRPVGVLRRPRCVCRVPAAFTTQTFTNSAALSLAVAIVLRSQAPLSASRVLTGPPDVPVLPRNSVSIVAALTAARPRRYPNGVPWPSRTTRRQPAASPPRRQGSPPRRLITWRTTHTTTASPPAAPCPRRSMITGRHTPRRTTGRTCLRCRRRTTWARSTGKRAE